MTVGFSRIGMLRPFLRKFRSKVHIVITVFGVNSKRFRFNVASGAQYDILINYAIQIHLLNTLSKLNTVICSPCSSSSAFE